MAGSVARLLLTGCAILAAGCAPREPAPASALQPDVRRLLADPEDPPLGPGAALLRAEILLPEAPYRVGDKLDVRLRLTNISGKPLIIGRADSTSAYLLGRRIPLYALWMTGPDGRDVRLLPVVFIDRYFGPITSGCRVDLAPGQAHVEKLWLYGRDLEEGKLANESGYDLNRPGKYRLWFHFACAPGSKLSLGDMQCLWASRSEDERRAIEQRCLQQGAQGVLESLRPPDWLKELARCHVAAAPAELTVLPGTPREALKKWKPPPPVPPEKFLGRRYCPAGFSERRNPLPKELLANLARPVNVEFEAGAGLSETASWLREKVQLPLSAVQDAGEEKLACRLALRGRPLGDCLYWLARFTGTRLALRESELVLVKGQVPAGAVEVLERHLPCARLQPDEEHPAVSRLGKLVSAEMSEASLGEALRFVESVSDIPVAAAPGIAEKKLVSVKVAQVPLKTLLDQVVDAAGCDYEVRRGLIYVYPRPDGH